MSESKSAKARRVGAEKARERTVGGVSEHDTLVTGSVVLESSVVESLGDIGRLLLDGDEDVAGLVVESLLRVVVADALDGITDDLLVVEVRLGGDLTEDHDHTGWESKS